MGRVRARPRRSRAASAPRAHLVDEVVTKNETDGGCSATSICRSCCTDRDRPTATTDPPPSSPLCAPHCSPPSSAPARSVSRCPRSPGRGPRRGAAAGAVSERYKPGEVVVRYDGAQRRRAAADRGASRSRREASPRPSAVLQRQAGRAERDAQLRRARLGLGAAGPGARRARCPAGSSCSGTSWPRPASTRPHAWAAPADRRPPRRGGRDGRGRGHRDRLLQPRPTSCARRTSRPTASCAARTSSATTRTRTTTTGTARTSRARSPRARATAIGLTGLAYGVKLMPIKVLDRDGEGDSARIASGIRWAADHGAKIINLSFEFPSDITRFEIPNILDAIRYAKPQGRARGRRVGQRGRRRGRLPGALEQRALGRRDDPARLPGRLLQRGPGPGHRGARRRRRRRARGRPELPARRTRRGSTSSR